MMENVYGCISLALDILASLNPGVYPNLCHYASTTTVFKHLEAIMQLFQDQEKPVVTIEGKAYFLFSQKYIQQWSKAEMDCGGKEETWQSHKVFLLDLGLLKTYTVQKYTENAVLNRILDEAKRKKQRSETLWTIPLYDDVRLQEAERIAGLYHRYGISVAKLRKNVIIRFRGQTRANKLYADWRKINSIERTVIADCHEAITAAVEAKGYTTFKEMMTRVRAVHAGREYHQQRLAELLHPEETCTQDAYTASLILVLEEKALLCHEVGCIYRQIRKTDREALNLPTDLKSWIIVPEQYGSRVSDRGCT